ncbi:hypothetical protein EVAR_25292_1 [Eumeta japonica]|uniref:Uncharacterized protein n=1 Tax=Eumeta variegata TaxID=151549 RepID=A0A4C1VPH3_EUMVA|nr:hypothetical protein EVAR_25292_1 [Eumeta japonica]
MKSLAVHRMRQEEHGPADADGRPASATSFRTNELLRASPTPMKVPRTSTAIKLQRPANDAVPDRRESRAHTRSDASVLRFDSLSERHTQFSADFVNVSSEHNADYSKRNERNANTTSVL